MILIRGQALNKIEGQQSEVIALEKDKKFLLGLCALIVAAAMVSVGVTLAAWPETRETNVVTIGNVKVNLIDEYEENDSVSPEVDIDKVVKVQNVGNTSCYVRVLVRRAWTKPGGSEIAEGLSADLIVPAVDNVNWTKGASPIDGQDGQMYDCYYYRSALPAGQTTEPLFENFKIDGSGGYDPEKYGGYVGHIYVYAQAVQSEYVTTDGENPTVTITDGKVTSWSSDLVFD